MKQTHRLLLYMPIEDNLALIDTLFGDDKDELLGIAQARMANNPDYKAVMLSYDLSSAEIVGA